MSASSFLPKLSQDQSPQSGSTGTKLNMTMWMALASIMFVDFLSSMDSGIVNNVLPRIAADLNGLPLFAWAATGNLLGRAIATLLFGKLSDMFGRQKLLFVSLALFSIGALGSGLATSFEMLIGFRALEGLGTGALIPIAFMIVADMFSSRERGQWASTLNVASMLAFLVGPTLGGVIADNFGWRYTFAIGAPFIIFSVVFAWFGLKETGTHKEHKIDYLGGALMIVAIVPMLLGLSWGGSSYPWTSPTILGLLGFSLVVWLAFFKVESGASEPMLSTRVLANRVFLTGSMWALFTNFGLTGLSLYLPLFLQGVQGTTASVSGQIMTPWQVIFRLMSIVVGILLTRMGRYKIIAVLGTIVYLAAIYWMTTWSGGTGTTEIMIVSVIIGISFGTMPTLNTIMVQNAFPKRLIGEATGGVYFFAALGGVLSPALLGTVMTGTYAETLKANIPFAQLQALDAKTLGTLNNPRALLDPASMNTLKTAFSTLGANGPALLDQTLNGMRASLNSAISAAFLVATVCAAIGLLIILTVPNNPLSEHKEDSATIPVPAKEGAPAASK
jgi:EmrB/QacA subfamily drug resistance transporter